MQDGGQLHDKQNEQAMTNILSYNKEILYDQQHAGYPRDFP